MFFLPWFPKEQLGNTTFLEPKSLSKKSRGNNMFVYVCLGKILGDYYRTFSKGWPEWFGSLLFTKKKRIDRSVMDPWPVVPKNQRTGFDTDSHMSQNIEEPMLEPTLNCHFFATYCRKPLVLWDFSKTLDWRRLSFSNSMKRKPQKPRVFSMVPSFFVFGKFWKTGTARGCNKIKEPPNTVWWLPGLWVPSYPQPKRPYSRRWRHQCSAWPVARCICGFPSPPMGPKIETPQRNYVTWLENSSQLYEFTSVPGREASG